MNFNRVWFPPTVTFPALKESQCLYMTYYAIQELEGIWAWAEGEWNNLALPLTPTISHEVALPLLPRTVRAVISGKGHFCVQLRCFIPASEASCGIGSRGCHFPLCIRYLLPGGCTEKGIRHHMCSRSVPCTSWARLELG